MLALSQIPSILRLEEEESRLDCSDQTKASRVVGGQAALRVRYRWRCFKLLHVRSDQVGQKM